MLPQVYEAFVRTGKVELIYLDLPPRGSFKVAVAAACAGDQDMFWDMHHYLFANQRALGLDRLPGYAEELGLDLAVFEKCLASERHVAGIREDIRTAQHLGITGTPAYLLGRRLPGTDDVQVLEIVKGLPPYEVLKQKLDALLASK